MLFLLRRPARELPKPRRIAGASHREDEVHDRQLRHEQYGQSSERSAFLEQLETRTRRSRKRRRPRARRARASLPRQRPRRWSSTASSARGRRAVRCPIICRANASSARAFGLWLLRWDKLTQDRRGHHRDAGGSFPASEGEFRMCGEKFSCRACEKIKPAACASHPIARGPPARISWPRCCSANTGCIAAQRQSAAFAREGIDLDVTFSRLVGASAATLMPLIEVVRSHVFAAEPHSPTTRRCRCWPRADADRAIMDLYAR